jgi:hypothetical protein
LRLAGPWPLLVLPLPCHFQLVPGPLPLLLLLRQRLLLLHGPAPLS